MDSESQNIYNQYRIIVESLRATGKHTEELTNEIIDNYEEEARKNRYKIDEYLKRLALTVHEYKDDFSLLYELEGYLMRSLESNRYELEAFVEDFSIYDYGNGLKDIIQKGTESRFWDVDSEDDYRPEGSWNARDQENINDYAFNDDDDFALNG